MITKIHFYIIIGALGLIILGMAFFWFKGGRNDAYYEDRLKMKDDSIALLRKNTEVFERKLQTSDSMLIALHQKDSLLVNMIKVYGGNIERIKKELNEKLASVNAYTKSDIRSYLSDNY